MSAGRVLRAAGSGGGEGGVAGAEARQAGVLRGWAAGLEAERCGTCCGRTPGSPVPGGSGTAIRGRLGGCPRLFPTAGRPDLQSHSRRAGGGPTPFAGRGGRRLVKKGFPFSFSEARASDRGRSTGRSGSCLWSWPCGERLARGFGGALRATSWWRGRRREGGGRLQGAKQLMDRAVGSRGRSGSARLRSAPT